ncbi:MAG: hypothetical protein R3A78_15065 [Polyangiales bacterium]
MLSHVLDPSFEPLLEPYPLDILAKSEQTMFGLWADLRLAYWNPAWERFAQTRGGEDVLTRWPLGTSIVPALGDVLRDFYVDRYAAALASRTPWEHSYECPTPTQRNQYRMRVLPLGERGFLVVNSLEVVEAVDDRVEGATDALEARYRNPNGFIVQCSNCRRTRHPHNLRGWDWVSAFIAKSPPYTSHGLCAPCYGFYYSDP